MCFLINTFLITTKENYIELLFCLLCFMGVRFGVYEKTYSTDTEASISVVSAVCTVSAFIMPFIIALVQLLFLKGPMSWILILDSYYHNWILRWAGHIARMPMTRAPRQLLTRWVAHSRPSGCPEMTWGRTLKKALKCKGLPANFKEWRAIAEARSVRRSQTYSRPMPPSENCPCRVHESKDEHCITQKDTQPSQACFETGPEGPELED